MAEAIVDRFEIVEIEQHDRNRARIGRLPAQLSFAVLQEGAAIGNAGERIDQRGGPVAIFGAFLGHRQQDESDRDREQQRLEAEHGEPDALKHLVAVRRPRQHGAERRPQQIERTVGKQHEDRRPARHQWLTAAAPEFIRRRPSIGGDDAGAQKHADVPRRRDARNMAQHQPQRGAAKQQDRQRAAVVENARTGPSQRKRGEQQAHWRDRSRSDRRPCHTCRTA